VKEIERCLARVRKKGFAVADPEVIIGLRVLAVPVLNIEGYSVAAFLSFSGFSGMREPN
jgi:DNA-binding IclR family transcriptional regulator